MTGGYQILDVTGVDFTSGVAETVKGALAKVISKKATMVSGLVIGGVSYPDFYAPFIASSDKMQTSVTVGDNALTITVAANDEVTVTIG